MKTNHSNKEHPDKWNEKRYRDKVYSLMNRTNTHNAYRRVKIKEAYDYFYGNHVSEEYTNLLTLHESKAGLEGNTPFKHINFDSISHKLTLLLGELRERGFDIAVNAINRDAILRKEIFKRQMSLQMRLQPMYSAAEQFTGVPYGANDNLPKTDDDLEEYMESYRDLYEQLMESAVRHNLDLYKYPYLRKNLFLDLLISNEIHVKAEVRNGYPQFRRVHPLNCIWDDSSEDDYQSDSSFFIEAYYMNIPDAIEKFQLDEKDIKELIKKYENGENGWGAVQGTESGIFSPFEAGKGSGWSNTEYTRILILQAEWLDTQRWTQKRVEDKKGNLHVHEYYDYNKNAKLKGNEKRNPNAEVVSKYRQVVRKATVIGGEYVTDTGLAPNMVRDFENSEITKLNYISTIHNYNGQVAGTSLVNKLGALQDMKNYVLTIMQKEVTTTIGSLIAIDTSKIDTNIYGKGRNAIYKLLQTAKSYGLVAYNGAMDSVPDGTIPFRSIEPKQQALIRDAIMLAQYFDEEMEKISGIDKSRMGTVGERTLATVNSQRLNQSQLTTDSYFVNMEGFEARLFERHVQQIAMTWVRHPEKYENIAARLGIEIPDDFEIDMQSYQCFVRPLPTSKRLLLQLAGEAVAANALPIQDYVEIMLLTDRDLSRGLRKWLRIMRKREKEQQELQRQQLEAEQKAKQAAIMAQMQGQLANTQAKNEGGIEKQRVIEDGMNRRDKLKLGVKERENNSHYALSKEEIATRNKGQ